MTGVLSIPFAILAAIIPSLPGKVALAFLAVASFYVAGYLVWRRERESSQITTDTLQSRIADLEAAQAAPDIHLELMEVHTGTIDKADALFVRIRVTNHGHVTSLDSWKCRSENNDSGLPFVGIMARSTGHGSEWEVQRYLVMTPVAEDDRLEGPAASGISKGLTYNGWIAFPSPLGKYAHDWMEVIVECRDGFGNSYWIGKRQLTKFEYTKQISDQGDEPALVAEHAKSLELHMADPSWMAEA